jgi:murein DD-endopeptidase MepM/ murein hydrolase activator NlpD
MMPPFGIYLLEVSACLISFYLFYFVFLRKKTFFVLNRAFLMCACVASFVIPELSVTTDQVGGFTAITAVVKSALSPFHGQHGEHLPGGYHWNYNLVLGCIYVAGVLLVLFRSVFHLIKMRALILRGVVEIHNRYRVIREVSTKPFVFFNLLFLPEGEINPIIFEHEKTHIRQYHWVDQAVLEILSIVVWFNPFVILIRRALKEQHEFLADAWVVRSGVEVADYYHCLLGQLQSPVSFKFTHNFSYHSIKNRINMLSKERNRKYVVVLYFVFVPIAAALIMGFGNRQAEMVSLRHLIGHPADTLSFISPLEAEIVTSTASFGLRENPFTKKMQIHSGMDFSAPTGQSVVSVASGIVIDAFSDRERGNFVAIRHDDTYTTTYSHLHGFIVRKGDRVAQGQQIGAVGSTGLSTGPHLHFEVHVKGEPVDPEPFLKMRD